MAEKGKCVICKKEFTKYSKLHITCDDCYKEVMKKK
jgi:DNA-directed RNA polymerase subunit RPC12/RpoP